MKRIFLTILSAWVMLSVMAIPAKKGQWQTITLADGTTVEAQLVGDEHVHFWMTATGERFRAAADGRFEPVSAETIGQQAAARRAKMSNGRRLSPRRVTMGERTHYQGQKKGIVILVQYTDVSFKSGNNLAKYQNILNQEGYNQGSFRGSVSDYFRDQSNGQFELTFDVLGPVTLAHNQSYYGGNDYSGNDQRAEEMIVEAVQAVDSQVDFSDYDWDGDGAVDQVFVLYAGKGEADGGYGVSNTVWPHMWELSATDKQLTLDGVLIDTYACSNEIDGSGNIEGIGCFCHEFSHCMGFPDFYDTSYSGWFGMDDFDLMCSGSYNGGGFCPPNYTAHEKMMCGWKEPIVLGNRSVTVENLASASNNGDTYIIYNEAFPDEYYTIENRQKTGWDTSYPARGLMITHVDFDFGIWQDNTPNTKVTQSQAASYGYSSANDHQRMTIFHADNTESSYSTSTDLYPYQQNDSLTAASSPAATLYNANADGGNLMKGAILDIRQNSDGTMSFRYRADERDDEDEKIELSEDVLFYESFSHCAGTGGDDDKWSATCATSTFEPDNDGWEYDKAYGGYRCARFGSGSKVGRAVTPAIELDGEAELTFKAAAWNKDGLSLNIGVEPVAADDGQSDEVAATAVVLDGDLTMKSFEWTEYSVRLVGVGAVKVVFQPAKRFFLDSVKIERTEVTDNIRTVDSVRLPPGIYGLDGRYRGTDTSTLGRGVYIINGKKVVK